MKVLIFHGYLLLGTGSNVYNAELGAALVRAGHEVHMLCQEREPFEQDWVDAAGDWDGGELALQTRAEPVRATVYRPDLGGLLPVYVADRYDGIEARPFQELSEAEVDAYLARNVAAVREVAERVRPDVALANHLVMGPLILARASSESRGANRSTSTPGGPRRVLPGSAGSSIAAHRLSAVWREPTRTPRAPASPSRACGMNRGWGLTTYSSAEPWILAAYGTSSPASARALRGAPS